MKTIQLSLASTLLTFNAMALELSTSITINATPAKVWEVLMDFQSYPAWNPFITKIEGDQVVGSKLKALIQDFKMKPTVQVNEPGQHFEWLGHLWIPGLFDGRHSFRLIDNGNGTTTLVHSEQFGGVLFPLMKRMLETKTLEGFKAMNAALKKRVEETV